MRPRFWETCSLAELTPIEWEALCDGCARCCLHKLEDIDSGSVHYTRVACRLLDIDRCRCRDYQDRCRRVPDCIVLTPQKASLFDWLPDTCAYRRLNRGQSLSWWHPLVSGTYQSVHAAGISVRPWAVPESAVDPDRLEAFLISL